jgi:autotransporter-associated beta strand protein
MKAKSKFHRPVLAFSITLALSQLHQAQAADGTWTTGSGGIWSSASNWSGGTIANGVNSTANFSTLDVSGTTTVSLNSSRSIGNITFGNTGYHYNNWILDNNGNTGNVLILAVGAGSPTVTVSNTTQATISANIAGTSGLTQAGYGGQLTLSGLNTYTGTTTIKAGSMVIEGSGTLGTGNDLTIEADTPFVGSGGSLLLGGSTQNVGNVQILGTGDKISWGNLIGTHYAIINNGIDAGGNEGLVSTISAGLGGISTNLNKIGEAGTILSGLNTYGGSTSIGQGTLQFANTDSLYASDDSKWLPENIIVDSTATLAINVGGAGEFTTQQAKNLLGTLSTGINNNGLRVGANFAIDTTNAAGDTTFDQVIADSSGTGSGALGFTKLGTGKVILNQVNIHTGATTINGGTLAIAGPGTLGNNNALAVNNSGTLDLGGTTQTVGDVSLDGGSITNGSLLGTSYTASSSQYSSSTVSASLGGTGVALTVTGGVTLSGNNTYSGDTTINGGGITISGAGTLGVNSNLLMNDGSLNLGGTTQTVGTVVFQDSSGNNGISNGTLTGDSFSISNTSSFTASPSRISAELAGAGANLEKFGIGRVSLSGTNSYAGTTTIHEGTLRFEKSNSLYGGDQTKWTKANLSVEAGGTLELAVGGAGGFTIGQSKTLFTNLSTSLNNNGLQAGSTFSISLSISGSDQIFDQVISDSTGVGGGAIGFMNRGNKTLTLNQANTYTGPTTVAGRLAISGAGTLGNHADLIVGGPNLFLANLDLGGTTQTVGAVTMFHGEVLNGNLISDSYAVQSGFISAGLGGAGASFTKTGVAGDAAYLSGTNTYTGATTVNGGELHLEKTASLYNSDASKWTKANISVASGTTLGVSVGGASEFSISQAKTLLTNLTTSINNNGLQAGSTFEINTNSATGDTTFDQVIANSTGTGGGALGLAKEGAGILIFNRANTYTGPTTVNYGTLAISGAGTLGNNSALTVGRYGVNSGISGSYGDLDLGGTTQTVGAVVLMGAVSNGSLSGTGYTIDYSGTISAGLRGTGANLTTSDNSVLTLSGTNTYTGTTTVGIGGSLQLAKAASLYNGDISKWTKANVSLRQGTLAVNVGGAGEFSVAQTKTLLSNLTTSINNNGLQSGSFAIDTSNAPGDTTFNQVIADSTGIGGYSLGFTKLGANKLILDQENTYTGQTTVSGGTLVMNGSISTSMGTYVDSGATLAGSGSVGSITVAAGGIIAPGNSPGILNTGSMDLAGTLSAEINGTAVGANYDQVNVTGTVTLSGMLTLTMTGFAPSMGNLFILINNDNVDAVNGTFSGLAQDTEFTMAGQQWAISYNADADTNSFSGGNDVALMSIPEPSAALLTGLSLLAFLGHRRRTR